MTTAALKKKIKSLVDRTTNEKKLARALALLERETREEAVERDLLAAAQASEADIKAGRTMSMAEFNKSTDAFMQKLFDGKAPRRVAAARRPKAVRARKP